LLRPSSLSRAVFHVTAADVSSSLQVLLVMGVLLVIASVSEAIQRCGAELDCFVAVAPRNDDTLLQEPCMMESET
jgi:hypothetical protein